MQYERVYAETDRKRDIVVDGLSSAAIVVTDDADQQTLDAAKKLSEYVERATGAKLPIGTRERANSEIHIHVGTYPTEDADRLGKLLQAMNDGDGYVIDVREDGRSLSIVGPTSWGTEFGVIEFLERYVGVRWLMPGPDGVDVPQSTMLSVPFGTVSEEPATISRHFFGMERPVEWTEWTKNNRMHDKIQFHHNLMNLFDTNKFRDHPEYYPNNTVPAQHDHWQPCFNDATAAVAINEIIAFFDAHPDEISYSLGINDYPNFCELDPRSPNYTGGGLNSLGLPNMSDVYYPWVNKVAEGLLAVHPDKYFGLLAYAWVYDVPTNLRLNPRVIPYITDDRMTWNDRDFGDTGMRHTQLWQQHATQLGWYEYLYGSPYALPRVYPHVMAENYKYAQHHNVTAHAAELYPNFGEGPKPWVSAKLQWNPDLDVDELLTEWYVRAVGDEAAPYLKSYYELYEKFWTMRIWETSWYATWKGQTRRHTFLDFLSPSYLRNITKEELVESRDLLEQVVLKTHTDRQKKRARLLLRAFEYYEISALSFPSEEAVNPPRSEEEALVLIENSVHNIGLADRRRRLLAEFDGDLMLRQPLATTSWNGLSSGAFGGLEDWLKKEAAGGAVRMRLTEIVATTETELVRDLFAVLIDSGDKENLLRSASFEDGEYTEGDWSYEKDNESATCIERSNEQSRSGQYGMKIKGAYPNGGAAQNIPLTGGRYAAIVYYYVPLDSQTRGEIGFYHYIRSESKEMLGVAISDRKRLDQTKGRWASLEFIFEINDYVGTVNPLKVGNLLFFIVVWNQEPEDVVYLDDFALYKLE